MNFNSAYIISYFGKDDIRDKRVEYHDTQLGWIREKGLQPVVLSMDYRESDRREGVTYIDHQTVPPGQARNVLLDRFYNSDEDWAVFCDNDSFVEIREKYEPLGIDIFEYLRSLESTEFDIHGFYPIDGAASPYTDMLNKTRDWKSWIFRRGSTMRGCCFFLKNMKKHHGVEPKFSDKFEKDDGTFVMGEDLGFCLGMLKDGFTVMQSASIVLKEQGRKTSTWAEDYDYRNSLREEMYNIFEKEYGVRRAGGKMNYAEFFNRHKVQKEMIIPLEKVGLESLFG